MRVLITGAAGFVGSRLADVLLEGGHRVCGFDLFDGDDPPGWQQARLTAAEGQQRFVFVRGDVTDASALDHALETFKPDAVVHLASRKDLEFAEQKPAECLRLHLQGTAAVMLVCQKRNVHQAVIGSSAHVYGASRRFPFSEEDAADRPLSILGAALRAAELCAYTMSLQSPVNTTVLRLFSVYGPRQSPNRLLPRLAHAAERRAAMPLFGDGTAGRDFIYIDDAVVGILRALDRPAPFLLVNLGSGDTTTLGQAAELAAAVADVAFRKTHLPLRLGEMPQTFADMKVAQEVLGFVPSVGLEDGIRRTWAWHQARPAAFRA